MLDMQLVENMSLGEKSREEDKKYSIAIHVETDTDGGYELVCIEDYAEIGQVLEHLAELVDKNHKQDYVISRAIRQAAYLVSQQVRGKTAEEVERSCKRYDACYELARRHKTEYENAVKQLRGVHGYLIMRRVKGEDFSEDAFDRGEYEEKGETDGE